MKKSNRIKSSTSSPKKTPTKPKAKKASSPSVSPGSKGALTTVWDVKKEFHYQGVRYPVKSVFLSVARRSSTHWKKVMRVLVTKDFLDPAKNGVSQLFANQFSVITEVLKREDVIKVNPKTVPSSNKVSESSHDSDKSCFTGISGGSVGSGLTFAGQDLITLETTTAVVLSPRGIRLKQEVQAEASRLAPEFGRVLRGEVDTKVTGQSSGDEIDNLIDTYSTGNGFSSSASRVSGKFRLSFALDASGSTFAGGAEVFEGMMHAGYMLHCLSDSVRKSSGADTMECNPFIYASQIAKIDPSQSDVLAEGLDIKSLPPLVIQALGGGIQSWDPVKMPNLGPLLVKVGASTSLVNACYALRDSQEGSGGWGVMVCLTDGTFCASSMKHIKMQLENLDIPENVIPIMLHLDCPSISSGAAPFELPERWSYVRVPITHLGELTERLLTAVQDSVVSMGA